MHHVPHIIHWLLEETNVGGGAALAGIIIVGFFAFLGNPVMTESPECLGQARARGVSTEMAKVQCSDVFDEEALVLNLLFCVGGGAIGVGVAGIGAAAQGVTKTSGPRHSA
jgi:hypothetical protein